MIFMPQKLGKYFCVNFDSRETCQKTNRSLRGEKLSFVNFTSVITLKCLFEVQRVLKEIQYWIFFSDDLIPKS